MKILRFEAARERRGFTLIELLVVIAIIAILAAMLLPVFAQARDRARQASCSSNMKQIYLGLRMYAQDYDGSFPGRGAQGASGLRAPSDPQSMPALLNPYTKSAQIWVCPGANSELQKLGNTYQTSFNDSMLSPDSQEGDSPTFLLLWDCYSYKTVTPQGTTGSPTPASKPGSNECAHVGRTNFQQLFLDGHIKLYEWRLAKTLCRRD